jgi:hypothetical protein
MRASAADRLLLDHHLWLPQPPSALAAAGFERVRAGCSIGGLQTARGQQHLLA